MARPPHRYLLDPVRVAGDAAAGNATESFVEGHVHGVEETGDIRERLAMPGLVEGCRFPETGPVEVDGSAAITSPAHLGHQLGPGRKRAAERPLRQLQKERRDWLVDLRQARHREWLITGTHRDAEQSVQSLVAAFLIGLHVAGGGKG